MSIVLPSAYWGTIDKSQAWPIPRIYLFTTGTVISTNTIRRNLKEAQRFLAALEMTTSARLLAGIVWFAHTTEHIS